ncbi:MAG: glycosyltransferase [Chloroflexi bacterium]|nr:glycosyltransferase family 2 protein [Anaerolineaceae bacterium]NMB90342.1 glycosyltransferase [Chloroflexota bacterium]
MIDGVPRVSVITPSYNQAAYLEQTLTSVLDQGYPDLEYLVVDGGSTDGSVDIIRRYAGRLAWWTSEADRGQADAVNKGLARSGGEIIGWLNSDDYYLPEAIQAAVQAFRENPQAGLVYGDVLAVDGQGDPLNLLRYRPWRLEDLMHFEIIGQPSVFLRRSVLEQAGPLDLRFHFLLDHQLWLRMASLAPMVYVPQTWSAARFHAQAKNVAQAGSFGEEAYRIVDWMRSTPPLAERFDAERRRIWGGAHRINARYLSEGGAAGKALQGYWRSFWAYPPGVLRDWKRVLFTLLASLGLRGVRPLYLKLRKARRA